MATSARAIVSHLVLRVAALCAMLALAPFTVVAHSEGPACTVAGYCCPEYRSICVVNGSEHVDMFYASEGGCWPLHE